tara:strand:+ start:1191 stop:1835 length:645 start_codon:yes stop_codon:yes gene_type:complete
MIIQCEDCSRKFIVKDSDIPKKGRMVQCGYCSTSWHQMPVLKVKQVLKKQKIKSTEESDEAPSVDNIKASDGKTYRFLGSQWAELLPSGKTGLFARKKISQELDEITGRKEKKITKKRKKKIDEVDPSLENIISGKKLPDIYRAKEGLGFFGYIFLLIIVGFSIVGILKTFENDLINNFPEIEYIFYLLDEQLSYLSESVKNIIVIIQDLINSY